MFRGLDVDFVAGGGMGIFMGMLFGALEQPVQGDTMTARQHFVHAARTMSTKSMQMAKTFAVMGAIFAGTECVFEKVESFNFLYAKQAFTCLFRKNSSLQESAHFTWFTSLSLYFSEIYQKCVLVFVQRIFRMQP
jgi:hypothetical protein